MTDEAMNDSTPSELSAKDLGKARAAYDEARSALNSNESNH